VQLPTKIAFALFAATIVLAIGNAIAYAPGEGAKDWYALVVIVDMLKVMLPLGFVVAAFGVFLAHRRRSGIAAAWISAALLAIPTGTLMVLIATGR